MLTRESILAMNPGRELDRLVAERVMNLCVLDHVQGYGDGCVLSDIGFDDWEKHPYYGKIDDPELLPPYSTDLLAAWEVVEELQESHLYTDIRACADFYEVWITNHATGEQTGTFASPKLPEAICKAALLTTIREDNQ